MRDRKIERRTFLQGAALAAFNASSTVADCASFIRLSLVGNITFHFFRSVTASEGAIQEVADQLTLGLLLGHLSLIDVGSGGFIPLDEAFGGHNLHQLEDGGVTDFAMAFEGEVDVANGAGSLIPEDAEDFEFGAGGAGEIVVRHLGSEYYEGIRTVNEILRRGWRGGCEFWVKLSVRGVGRDLLGRGSGRDFGVDRGEWRRFGGQRGRRHREIGFDSYFLLRGAGASFAPGAGG